MFAQLTATTAGGKRRLGEGVLRPSSVPSARTLDRIERLHGEGLPVVSVYLAVHPGPDARRTLRTKADSLLHRVRSLATDGSLDHDARMSLRADIERIERIARTETLGRGALAIFACSGAGVLELVRLPRPVRDRIMVDATPWIGPMLAVLDQYRRAVRWWWTGSRPMSGSCTSASCETRGVSSIARCAAPRTPAGLGSPRSACATRPTSSPRRHFRELAEALDRLFRADRYDILVVGGHEHELPGFLDFLPRTLRERVAGTFAIDPRTATAATVRSHVEPILERYQLDEQQRSVSELLQAVASGGLAVAGLEPCLWAGSLAAVRALLVQDGAVAPGRRLRCVGMVRDERGGLPAVRRPHSQHA